VKKFAQIAIIATLLFFGVNFYWTHAALASVSDGMQPCSAELASAGQARVRSFFGTVKSHPWVLCQRHPALGLDVSFGDTRFAPFLPALVIIGPDGANADVLAHEWTHAELSARTSILERTISIPTWFDEGLGMQVDTRPEYDRKALAELRQSGELGAIRLQQIANPTQFFVGGERGRAHYALAKCAVGQWVSSTSVTQRAKFYADIDLASEFPSALFEQHASKCLRGTRG
jgi:hypothetical protein